MGAKLSKADRRTRKIVTVEAVDVFRHCLYGAPFPEESNSGIECPHCGEWTKKDPCVHCGYPITLPYAKPESSDE